MSDGTKVHGVGPGIISGNLVYIGAFVHKEDADFYLNQSMSEIPMETWDITEGEVVELNGKYVVRLMATKKQMEFTFHETEGDLFEQA